MHIAVIGAGASGILAALHAAWTGASVTLFEGNASVGRKLLVTGSGRCNITNANAAPAAYTCADPAWLDTLFARFGVADLLEVLHKVGIPVRPTFDGWYYPLSESAHTVVNAFHTALTLANVELLLGTPVKSFTAGKHGFRVNYTHEDKPLSRTFDRLILSAGGKAYPNLGSRGDLFSQLTALGHIVLPMHPALSPVLADLGELRSLQGMRFDAAATLRDGDRVLAQTAGNLIVTQNGFNGPAVMDLSHRVPINPPRSYTLSLDLLHFFRAEFDAQLRLQQSTSLPLGIFLGGYFAPQGGSAHLRYLGIPESTLLTDLPQPALDQIIAALTDTRFSVRGVGSFDQCQVTAGGVPVTEVSAESMESLRVPGLYLIGETLDVVGPCGGYNLQYAFSSGAVAGLSAAV